MQWFVTVNEVPTLANTMVVFCEKSPDLSLSLTLVRKVDFEFDCQVINTKSGSAAFQQPAGAEEHRSDTVADLPPSRIIANTPFWLKEGRPATRSGRGGCPEQPPAGYR